MRKHIQIGKRSLEVSTNARRSWNDLKIFKAWNYRHIVWWKFSLIYQWDFTCEACEDTFEDGHGNGCQSCCDHSDADCYSCFSCGMDMSEEYMSRAYDRAKDIYKYGE